MIKVIELKRTVTDSNDRDAERLRRELSERGIFLLNLMSAPGSGKTTLLSRTITDLFGKARIGVMEADIASDVDAIRIHALGAESIQVHTDGMCHMDAGMTKNGLMGLEGDLDIVFLENIGNLICHNLTGIKVCEKLMPGVPQVAVFDTGFHQTMPDFAYLYALPYEYYEKYHIRRYGFHGTSHRYVSMRAAAMLGKKPEDLKIVTCHLGNGSSIAAVKGGKCYDTTMGLTPLEGIIMGTRCGSIDPAIVPLLMKKENLTPDEIDTIMNKKSGILGVTGGVTSDNRDIEDGAKAGNKRYQLVESMLVHQLTKYIGGYAAAMGGVDAIVFAGGIGENNPQYRTRVAENLAFLGVKIDEELNQKAKRTSVEYDISAKDAKVKMLVIPTNEELMIAKDTMELVSK